jgi:hypothetical protein
MVHLNHGDAKLNVKEIKKQEVINGGLLGIFI